MERKEPLVIADDFQLPLEAFAIPPQYQDYVKYVLLPHGMIVDRCERLAQDIRAAYAGSTPHFLVVLKGGNEFAMDLTRHIREQHAHAGAKHVPFVVDFVRVKSYEGTETTGKVTITGIDLSTVAGKELLLIEDIIDTGVTMTRLIPELLAAGAKSVRVASLLEKRTERSCGYKADFVGFSVPDHFVVGYNLDYDEAFRDMPHICIINDAGIAHFRHFVPPTPKTPVAAAAAAAAGVGAAAAGEAFAAGGAGAGAAPSSA